MEYQVSEIFIPVNRPDENQIAKEIGVQIVQDIKADRISFDVAARQYSKSVSSMQGGSIGWVQQGDLSKELDIVVRSLSQNQISPPIKTASGYYILTLNNQRLITHETLPTEDEILNEIGLERLDKIQKKYLADIRAASLIERRP